MREQIAFRPPTGTKARMEALRRPGKSLLDVLLRAIEVLEQSQAPTEVPASSLERLDRLDADLAELRAAVAKLMAKPPAPPKRKGKEPGAWTRLMDDNPDLVEDV